MSGVLVAAVESQRSASPAAAFAVSLFIVAFAGAALVWREKYFSMMRSIRTSARHDRKTTAGRRTYVIFFVAVPALMVAVGAIGAVINGWKLLAS